MMSDGSRQPPTLLLSSALTGVMWAALRRGASGLRVFWFRPAIPGFVLLVRVQYNLIPNRYLYKQLLYLGALMVELEAGSIPVHFAWSRDLYRSAAVTFTVYAQLQL